MEIEFYKYHGTGNDFILIDDRNLTIPLENSIIKKLCDRRFGIGADGLILLQKHPEYDFNMLYFNSNGKESSMCGNGGRCVVAFAASLGIIKNQTSFNTFDGLHKAIIKNDLIELSMKDVREISKIDKLFLLDTGSPHAVLFVNDVKKTDVKNRGKKIRNDTKIAEEGVNVNFVKIISPSEIKIRTYERGVEDETLSCGTGSVASAIISFIRNKVNSTSHSTTVNVEGGQLKVSFDTSDKKSFTNIKLTGPTEMVYSGKTTIL